MFGTAFSSLVEGWRPLDALYFSVVTIGYGDLAPQTHRGKIFTMGHVFVGVGTLGLFLSPVARSSTHAELHAFRRATKSDARDDDLE